MTYREGAFHMQDETMTLARTKSQLDCQQELLSHVASWAFASFMGVQPLKLTGTYAS